MVLCSKSALKHTISSQFQIFLE